MPPSPILPWQETHNPEYRTAKGWRIFVYVAVPLLVALFVALPFLMMGGKNPSVAVAVGFGAVSFGMAGFMIYGLFETIRGGFTIGSREVSQVGALKTKTLALNEILGYRIDDKYTRIYPKETSLHTIKIGYTTERYSEINHWLAARYPDLDQTETEQATAAILADDALGDTPEARATALGRAQQVARLLNIAGGAVTLWLFFYPTPYKWAIAAGLLLPALATAALWLLPRTLRIVEKKNGTYPTVTIAFIGPSLCLLIRTLSDQELVSYAPLWSVAGAVAAGTAGLLAVGSRRFVFRPGETASVGFTIALLALLYGYGATLAINSVYDDGAATTFTPQVIDKHISSGKTTTYHLRLKPWGPVPTAEDVQVSAACYRQVQPGQTVTVALLPGRLGVPWFTVME
jgi:hypothetical protein